MWQHRPSALKSENAYERATRSSLELAYQNDNKRASSQGVKIPHRPREESIGRRKYLRTCQWNVLYFKSTRAVATEVVKTLLATDPDIIVLNEFGTNGGSVSERVRDYVVQCLEGAGYTVLIADSAYPTGVATRLPVQQYAKFPLDHIRAAVSIQVRVDGDLTDSTIIGEGDRLIWIYGTHLEDSDVQGGKYRLLEMQALLKHLEHTAATCTSVDEKTLGMDYDVLLVGDLNQQRQEDYSDNEWTSICVNKQRRKSPQSDGVADKLKSSGFSCVWDKSHYQTRSDFGAPKGKSSMTVSNWRPGSPPPSTHWTGTIIDYTWYRPGVRHPCIKRIHGVYVSPSNLSDHRLVVCDWELA